MTTETIQMLLNLIVKETEILYKMNPDREIEIRRVLNNCFDNLGQIYASNIQSGFPEKPSSKCATKCCNEKAEPKWGLCHTCWCGHQDACPCGDCFERFCITDRCGNKAAPKDEDSECWNCDGSNCNNSCRYVRHWNCCDECFKKDQDESEDEETDQHKKEFPDHQRCEDCDCCIGCDCCECEDV